MRRAAPWWAWAGLAAVLLFDVWWRGHTVGPSVRDRLGVAPWPVVSGESEPLDCDEAVYAYIGRRLNRGDVLYRDLTEPKPPGGYWLYAAAVAVGGATEWTVRLVPIPLVLATLGLIWWLGLRLSGPGAACASALLAAVLTTDPYLYGNGANLEHIINLASVASLALMVRGWDRPGRGWPAAAGAAVGAACLVKQVAFVHGFLYVIALMLRREAGGEARTLGARLGDVLALAGGAAAVAGLAAAVLVLQGAGAAAFEEVIRYGGTMAAETPPEANAPMFLVRWITGNADPRNGALPWPFGRTDYLVWWGTGSWPVWVAAGPALGWLLLGPTTGPRRLLAGWTLSAWIQVALPGLFWAHYYLLPVPGIAPAVSILLADACRGLAGRGRRITTRIVAAPVVVALAAALGWTGYVQVRDYLLVPPEELTIRYKGGRQWVALRDLGRELARRTAGWDDPRLFVWGWQSPLFVYSGLDGVSRHFFADPLMKAFAGKGKLHPLIWPRLDRIMDDLRAHPPALVFAGDPPFPALMAFLQAHARPSQLVPVAPDGRGLWVDQAHYREFEARPIRAPSPPGRGPG